MDFVVATTHSSTRPEVNLADITEWSKTSIWNGLEILETQDLGNDQAVVSFAARFTQQGKEQNHREKSQFEREDGKWRFVTGEQLKNPTVRYETPRAGRNDPCPCGSGKKFKKCCAA
jgi:SEC-C motif-containing protein